MKPVSKTTASGKKTGSGSRRRIAPDWQRVVAISGAKAKGEDREERVRIPEHSALESS
jgi:hypothetical protein